MKCLIVAAGKGSRLWQRGDVKPLVPILGIPLIERVIRSAVEAGLDDFYVVSGYRGERVRTFLDGLARRCRVKITHVINEAWEQGNGLSVLKARKYLNEHFVLLMADHLFDPSIVHELIRQPPNDGEILLAVDSYTSSPLVDMKDVTRVKIVDGRVSDIGKGLMPFNGFDTGIFLCTPPLFEALEHVMSEDGDTSLSGGVHYLAARGRVKAFDIGGRFWIDVDDPNAIDKAERSLLARLRGKQNDGPVSRYLNRPLSINISRYLARLPVTPNQISLASFFCSVLAAKLFALGNYLALTAGGFLAQFASIIDGCDGEIARLKFQESKFGGWFDAVLDRYADAFLLLGLTWHVYTNNTNKFVVFIGFMAIIGSFMLSYTADKYDSLMRSLTRSPRGIRIGRDVRVFLVFLGALLNQPLPTLVIIAVLMNGEVIRRIFVCREQH
nr:hypothetical protein [Desulfobacterales bacterium]